MRNPLYHSTSPYGAATILRSKTFNLGASVNTSEKRMGGRKKKMFFLSTSRIMANRYRSMAGYSQVTLELNRDWFEARYQAKPVDYWGPEWIKSATGREKQTEKEERIYSETPFIKMPRLNDAIYGVYLYVNPERFDRVRDSRYIRTLLVEVKRARIPIYFFTNEPAYYIGNIRKSQPLSLLIGMLEIVPQSFNGRVSRDWTSKYRELFWKNSKKDLSRDAERFAYNLVHRNYNNDNLNVISADLHNQKNNATEMRKMALIWRKLKINTVEEYYKWLVEKWTSIYDAENR